MGLPGESKPVRFEPLEWPIKVDLEPEVEEAPAPTNPAEPEPVISE